MEKEDENMKPIISGFDRSSFLEDNNRKIVLYLTISGCFCGGIKLQKLIRYEAPEIRIYNENTSSSDIYALGALFFDLLESKASDNYLLIRRYYSIIHKCLNEESEKRLSTIQLFLQISACKFILESFNRFKELIQSQKMKKFLNINFQFS